MKPVKKLKKMILKHGRRSWFVDNDNNVCSTEFSAFIEPLMYKNKMYIDSDITDIGYVDEFCYLYLGPPDVKIDDEDFSFRIATDEIVYIVIKANPIFYNNERAYVWAILRPVIKEGSYLHG